MHKKTKYGACLNYKRPTSLQELRSFLGLMSYYRKFIKNFSLLAAPLTELTSQPRKGRTSRDLKKESKEEWDGSTWTDAHETAFQALKGALLSRPVLALPLKQRKWRLATDASKIATGAVLSQYDETGEEPRCIPVSKTSSK